MLDSFFRGLRMIWASIKMGWQDKTLLVPAIITVFSNIFFGTLIVVVCTSKLSAQPGGPLPVPAQHAAAPAEGMPTFGLLHHHTPPQAAGRASEFFKKTIDMTRVNGASDAGGMQSGGLGDLFSGENCALVSLIMALGWLVEHFFEGVTTALVYCHLTEGKGSGRMGSAVKAVMASLPALVILGITTWLAKMFAKSLKKHRESAGIGMVLGFLGGVVEVFWTLAGHLILPAIVIEGCSFWGGLKRADRIAQGNLLTIGIGEVGVDGICAIATNALYFVGMLGVGGGFYLVSRGMPLNPPLIGLAAFAWVVAVVIATAASKYIRAAFYTCLYVWAVEAEAVEETERVRVRPPEPLALALA